MSKWTPRRPLRIHGIECKVNLVDAKTDSDLEHGKLDGIYLPTRHLIKIDRKAKKDSQREALLHELLHAADQATGEKDIDESVICRLARFLYGVFRDNLGLAEYIAGDSDPRRRC